MRTIKKVFYNSSLPRSGSTLIQNILAQNPEIHTTPTSGIFEMFMSCRHIFTEGQEWKAQDRSYTETGFKGLLRGAIYGYFDAITDRPYAVDKCRGWGLEYDFIHQYEENPKIICMVRDLRGVYASLEKKYRKNPLQTHHIANFDTLTGTTTEKRIIHWSNNPPTGPAIERLYQIINQGTHKHILFVKFEDLCENPNFQMERIYDYFDIPYFQHDFDNIPQYTKENDNVYGVFGDHKIRQKLRPLPIDWDDVLGYNGTKLITDNYRWFYDAFQYKI